MEMGLPVVNVNHWQNLVYVSVASTLNLIHVAAPAIITLSFSLLLSQHYWALVAWRFVNASPPHPLACGPTFATQPVSHRNFCGG